MKQFENESCQEALKKRDDALYTQFEGNCLKLEKIWQKSTPAGYTSHSKDHIEMVEQYVGRLLGEERIGKLKNEELFILLMGTVCHDVGMIEYKTEHNNYVPDRENHNINSYSLIYDSSNNSKGEIDIDVPDKAPKYYQSIALLCLGHRDHKEGVKKICTLSDQCSINGKTVSIPDTITLPNNADIRVKYLAAILRLADEIDVTSQRAPKDVEMLLKDFITEEAKQHWCTHQLIGSVAITHEKGITTILLKPDKEEINAIISDKAKPTPKEQLLRLIFSRRKKIEQEIAIVNKITRDTSYIGSGLEVEYRIDVEYDQEVVTKDDFEKYQKDVDRQQKEERQTYPNMAEDDSESEGIAQIRKKSPIEIFNEMLQGFVRERNLLETGSFKFSFEKGRNEFTQYFINTQLLLTNRKTLDSITEIFKEHYKDKEIDCVIGIGKAGIVLAPNLSLKLSCNSSYLICDWEDTSSVKWEKSISVIETAKNVLVLLDVISTGTVTKQSLNIIREKNKTCLENIYIGTVFCTNIPKKEEIEKNEKVNELFSINDEFQFRTYSQDDYDSDANFRKEFELLPLRKK